jgi:hypothetical protein
MRYISMFLLILISVCLCGCVKINQRESVACQEPFVLEELHVWRDGGSLSFVFLCGDGERLSFRCDGGINSPTNGYFFLEIDNTREKLPLGGVKEKGILAVLESWLKNKFTDEDLDRIRNSTDFSNMTKDEFRAWHIKGLVDFRPERIKYLKNQRTPSSYIITKPTEAVD